jgi:hypothetical protein
MLHTLFLYPIVFVELLIWMYSLVFDFLFVVVCEYSYKRFKLK